MTIQQAFETAVRHHKAGQLQEAENLYRQILASQPGHAESLHFLGVIAYQRGRDDLAVELIKRAIALKPVFPAAQNNLGNALRNLGKLDEAIAAQRQAIADRPNSPEAYVNLGNAFADKGLPDDAIAAYRQAITLKPTYAKAHIKLGVCLAGQGRLDEAIAAYRQAIALNPGFPEAHLNLGNILRERGEADEAIAAYRQTIALSPNSPQAHLGLGNALWQRGEMDQAIAAYHQAIALRPDYAEAHNNLGNALKDIGRLDDAVAAFGRAIALRPNYAKAHSNLGIALGSKGQLDDAIAAYRRALAYKPDFAAAHSNLIYTMHYHPDVEARTIAEELGRWDRRHAQPLRQVRSSPEQGESNQWDPARRLRVGYVSADFWAHASAHFLVPLLENHDPKEVELFCYAEVHRPDAMTARMQQSVACWRGTTGRSDADVAEQVRADRIDILVDLKLHTRDNRLRVFAQKPASVQVSWLGYPGSSGLSAIDYRLSDPYLDPPQNESVYCEKTVRLPDTFWCYDPLDCRDLPEQATGDQQSRRRSGVITFGCLNNFCKVNDATLGLWGQVMLRVPGSRLLLLAHPGSHRQRTVDRLSREGIDPGRVEFVAPMARRDYLRQYHRIDIALDSFPYNGHTTSLDSFWMGVPVVTRVGQNAVSRAGWCQLSNLGLTELAGQTPEQFVKIAVELAGDLPRLKELRATLRQRMERSPLMDAPRFARNVEAAYRQMWRTWCGSEARNPNRDLAGGE